MKQHAIKVNKSYRDREVQKVSLIKRCLIILLTLTISPTNLLSDDRYRGTLADRSLRFIDDYEVAVSIRNRRETERLEKIILQAGGSELKAISALKLARLSKDKNLKLALQYLKIAESNLVPKQKRIAQLIFTDLAVLYAELGFDDQALAALSKIKAPLTGKLQELYFQTQSLCLSRLGKHNAAARSFEIIGENLNIKNLPDAYLMQMSKTFNSEKDEQRELRFLEVLASRYPFSEQSREALDLLKNYARRKDNPYHFSANLLRKLKLHSAVHSELEKSLPEFLDYPVEIDGHKVKSVNEFQRADLAMDLNLDEIAADIIEDIASSDRKLSHAEQSELLLLQARWHDRDGDHSQALDIYNQHKKSFPSISQTRRLQKRIANLHLDLGEFKLAAEHFEKYASRTNRREDRWLHFWSLYRAGDFSNALSLMDRRGYVMGHDSYSDKDEVLYWHGKVLERMEQYREASEKYSQLMVEYPNSFYTAILKAKLGKFQKEDQQNTTASLLYEAIKERLLGYVKGAKQMLLASKDSDIIDVSESERKLTDSPLVEFLKKPEIFNLSIKSDRYSEEQLYENYPKAFSGIVEPHAQRLGLDPYLTYSIMKAESEFDKDAISWVGAVGLMQIMPYTGFRIAKEMGDIDYEFKNLSEPHINISYAQYYIQRLVQHFGGNIVLALAAYNGGPNAVVRWLDRCKGCEIDEFVESIGYRETRRYVKKVIKNYAVYKSFYEEELPLNEWPHLKESQHSDDGIF